MSVRQVRVGGCVSKTGQGKGGVSKTRQGKGLCQYHMTGLRAVSATQDRVNGGVNKTG